MKKKILLLLAFAMLTAGTALAAEPAEAEAEAQAESQYEGGCCGSYCSIPRK